MDPCKIQNNQGSVQTSSYSLCRPSESTSNISIPVLKKIKLIHYCVVYEKGQYKKDFLIWKLILYACNKVVLGLLLVIVLTVLSNAQARSRKSTFVKNYNRIHSSQLSRKLGFVGEFNLVL